MFKVPKSIKYKTCKLKNHMRNIFNFNPYVDLKYWMSYYQELKINSEQLFDVPPSLICSSKTAVAIDIFI